MYCMLHPSQQYETYSYFLNTDLKLSVTLQYFVSHLQNIAVFIDRDCSNIDIIFRKIKVFKKIYNLNLEIQ